MSHNYDHLHTSPAPLPKIASRIGVEKKVRIDNRIARPAVIEVKFLITLIVRTDSRNLKG